MLELLLAYLVFLPEVFKVVISVVSFGAEMSPAKVVVGWQGSGADCSEAEEEESIYSEEERGSEAADDF